MAGPPLSLEQLLSTAVIAMDGRNCDTVVALQPGNTARGELEAIVGTRYIAS